VNFNSLKYRLLICLIIALPGYLVLSLIQGFNIFEHFLYAYYQYTIAVFLALVVLFEFHSYKSQFLEKYFSWDESFIKRIFTELFLTILVTPIVISLGYKIFYNYVWDMETYFPSMVFYNVIAIFMSLFFATYVNIEYFISRWKEAIVRAESLEKESMKSRLQALQSQLSPHFLFNNFNILNALIDEDHKLAKNYLENLSEVFRYILKNKKNEVVELKEELTFIENYAFLLGIRFKDKFHLKIDLKDDLMNYKIPPVSLQVLLENALQHNEASAKNPLLVEMYALDNKLVIRNKIRIKKGQVKSTQTGLSNIKSRYEYLTDSEVRVMESNNYFTVTLPLINS